MDKPNQATMSPSVHTVQSIDEEKSFTKFALLSNETQLLIWEFAVVAITPRIVEFEANLPKSEGRLIKTQLNTGRAMANQRHRGDRWPIIDYHGRLTFRCAFSTDSQHANGSPPVLLHTTGTSRMVALKSYQHSFSSFLERPIYYSSDKDLVYIN